MPLSLLVLVDFTQPAQHALAYADRLAVATGARLVLLHVRRDSILDLERLTGRLSTPEVETIARAMAVLVADLAAPATAEIGHGQVAEAVAGAVARHRPTLLVLGRTEADGTPDELLAATALDLLRAAPYPLLVVPQTRLAPPLPRRLLLAADGEDFTLGPAAGTIRHLLDALAAELTVLHVADRAAPPADPDQARNSVLRTGLADDLAAPVRSRQALAPHPADGILHLAAAADYDLLALIARPRSFWGQLFHRSVTAQVLLHSPLPVLVLPAAG